MFGGILNEIVSLLNSQTFCSFSIVCIEIQTLRFRHMFRPHLQAYFFQTKCHYMMIIFTVIKPGLT